MTDDTTRTFTLTLPDANGDRREIEISTGQLLDARAGKAFAYVVDEEILVDDDGRLIQRESALPPPPKDAA